MSVIYKVALGVCVSIALSACGGGGSDESSNPSTTNNSNTGGADGGSTPATNNSNTASYSVSGRITTSSNTGLPNVSLLISGAISTSLNSDASGNYKVSSLANGNYKITPFLKGYSFVPTYINFTISNSNSNNTNFVGDISTYPSTALITSYMKTLHERTLTQFLTDESALSSNLAARGMYSSGSHYTQSKKSYESLMQSFLDGSLKYIQDSSKSMQLDKGAIIQLLAQYNATDKSYAKTYYTGVNWGGSTSVTSSILNDINVDLDNMYSLITLQIQTL